MCLCKVGVLGRACLLTRLLASLLSIGLGDIRGNVRSSNAEGGNGSTTCGSVHIGNEGELPKQVHISHAFLSTITTSTTDKSLP